MLLLRYRCDVAAFVAACRGEAEPPLTLADATEADWAEEYLAPIISIKLVDSLDEAIAHVNRYGSHHTDSIITRDRSAAERFQHEVDSAVVMAVWWSTNWRLTILISTFGWRTFQAGMAERTISSTAGKAATVSTCCAPAPLTASASSKLALAAFTPCLSPLRSLRIAADARFP